MKTIFKIKLLKLLGVLILIQNVVFSQEKNVIEFDFCKFDSDKKLYDALHDFHVNKGDFFSVKINHINPYMYDIKVTAKNDTFKTGTAPALFSAFMDVSQLGTIASSISILSGGFTPSVNTNTMVTTEEKEEYNIYGQKNLNPKQKDIEDPNINKLKNSINDLTRKIENSYNEINECYTHSILNVYNAQVDCNNLIADGLKAEDCGCLTDKIKNNITSLADNKYQLLSQLNNLSNLLSKNKTDSTQKAEYSKLVTEIQSSKYSIIYLNKIYAKAHSNFLIADNIKNLSTYYSYPIQVQGDEIELKIDITPKAASKTVAKDSTKKQTGANTSTNSLSTQSPITVNITPDTKTATSATTTPTKGAKPSSATSDKKDSTSTDDKLSADELKVNMPLAVREYHLNYKYRINRFWYGFSAGFFADGLIDDNYTNKPVDPSNPNTQYKVTPENTKDDYKFGIMASVNGGWYVCKKHDWFLQLFSGPGLSIATTLQPRLLIGGGFGCGGSNKFSVNIGTSVGQVKRLSNAIDPYTTYTVPQTSLYYTKNETAMFVCISYIFDL